MTASPLLYGDHADLYDLVYTKVDFDTNGERIRDILRDEGVREGNRVLEAACGTGSYLTRLAGHYDMSGFDRSRDMLAISQRKTPEARHFVADLSSFSVPEPVDAILCLGSSIGYLLDEESLRGCLSCCAAALLPGGALIIEPWIAPTAFRSGTSYIDTYADDDVSLARVSHSREKNGVAVIDFAWSVSRRGKGIEQFRETHELWLCPPDTMQACLSDAGFQSRYQPEGLLPERGLWIANRSTRPGSSPPSHGRDDSTSASRST